MRKNDIAPIDLMLAMVLLTRIPLPHLPRDAFARQASAVWAFPVVGMAVALPACTIGALVLTLDLPATLAAGLIIASQILLTGAMHEDGLADVADGFWGGFDPARRLEIMKDSQIGTYGVLALSIMLGLRWLALSSLLELGVLWSLLAVSALSRVPMTLLMGWMPNARHSGLSQSVGRPPKAIAGLAVLVGGGIGTLGLGLGTTFVLACGIGLATFAVAMLAHRKIGGQTGDVLGASQQVSETVALITLLALLV